MSAVRRAAGLQIWYSKAALLRHGAGLGGRRRMPIQQRGRLAWIYAPPLVQTWCDDYIAHHHQPDARTNRRPP